MSSQDSPVASSKRRYSEAFDTDEESTAVPSNSETAGNDIPVKTLDPEGDVIIFVDNKKWLASAKVLSLASPVFSSMFGPHFMEGRQVRSGEVSGEVPTVRLEEDSGKIMGEILSMLHHRAEHIPLSISPNHALGLAIHSDKYDCRAALRPWSSHWINGLEKHFAHGKPIGYSLLTTYLFDRDSLPELAGKAVNHIAPDVPSKWRRNEKMALMPDTFIEAISQRVTDGLQRLHEEISRSEMNLRSNKLKRSQSCLSQGCNKAYLVSEYFDVLRRHKLWPSLVPFTTCSMHTIIYRFSKAYKDSEHQCTACPDCPLRAEIRDLYGRVYAIGNEMKPVPLGIPKKHQAA